MELVGTCGKEEKEKVLEASVVMEVGKEDKVPIGTIVGAEKVLGKDMGKEVTIGILKTMELIKESKTMELMKESMEPITDLSENTLHLLDF